MFGLTDPSKNPKRRKRGRSHLEFQFDGGEHVSQCSPDASSMNTERTGKTSPAADEATPPRVHATQGSNATRSPDSSAFPADSIPLTRTPKEKETNPMNTHDIPRTRITSADSIQRQKREQKAVHSVLNGLGLAFTCAILAVAALAALGGYVLYKQLSDQSATIALLEQNTKQRFFEMETDFVRRDTELAKNLEQTSLRVMNLTASFEEYRSQSMEMLAELRSTNKNLERQLRQAQQENAEHKMQLARLENTARLKR
ncbi:MAG: hypothetical protein ACFCUX_10155 [Candidatus Methylacidiphilales bacterium]